MDNSNGNSAPNGSASIERRGAPTSLAPVGDWRDPAAPVNVSGRYAVEESGGLDFSQMLGIVRRRWRMMLAVVVFCVAVSTFLAWRAKPIYQSMATLEMIPSTRQPVDTLGIPGLENFANAGLSRGLITQLEIIKGGEVRDAAVKKMTPEQRTRLRGIALDAGQRGNSNLVDILVRSLDARGAADYANAVCEAYVADSYRKNSDTSDKAISYVEGRVEQVSKELSAAQNNLSNFKKSRGVISLTDEGGALTGSLGGKRAALEQAQTQRSATLAQLRDQQAQLAAIPANKLVATGIQKNPAIAQLKQQLNQKEIERSSLLNEYTENSYAVKAVDAEIVSLRAQLKRQGQTEVTTYQPDPRRAPLEQSVATLQSQVLATDATIRELNQQIATTQSKINELPDQEFLYARLTSEVDLKTGLAKQFEQSLANLKIARESLTSNARIVSKASPNFGPVAPDKRRMVLTGLIMGLLSALALALLVDAMDNRIYNEEDAQRATHLPVLAQIPFIKKAEQQSLYVTGDRISPLLESNRMLRANISFCATDRPVKAVVVTSSAPNEGKSSSALNLAVAAALGGENVVLIDLDLRRPTQHVLTGLPNTAGFTNVIAGQIDVDSALQDTPIPNLRVLTSGPTPPNPYRMLNSQVAKATIDKIIATSDFVVIDTPPVLGLADARLISTMVDGSLMVISCQETGRREASRAADMMVSSNQEVLGAVLTKVPNSAYSYKSYSSYGRYFDEGQSTADKMDEAALAGKLDAAPNDRRV